MTTTIVVKSAEVASDYEGKFGPGRRMKIEAEDGRTYEWNTKQDRQPPAPGTKLEGETWEDEKWGWKFKLPQGQFGGGGSGGGGGGNRSAARNPQETASIVRQHSQHMALMYVAMKDGAPPPLDELKSIIDWFATDAQEASAKVKDTRPASQPTRDFLSKIMDGSAQGIRKPTGAEVKAALTAVGLPPTGGFGEKLLQWQASHMIDAFKANREEAGAFTNGDKSATPDPNSASDIPTDDAFAEFEEIVEKEKAGASSGGDSDDIPFFWEGPREFVDRYHECRPL
jgi:hypothetical protein